MNLCSLLFYSVWILAGLAPTNSDILPDDFSSVSCAGQQACFLLSSSGELFGSSDGAANLQSRSRIEGLEKAHILFPGTLHGWMISRGRLWRSRDGGKAFEALARPEGRAVVDMVPDEKGRLVLATADGWLYRNEGDARFSLLSPKVPGGIRQLRIGPDGGRLVIGADGGLWVLAAGASKWSKSSPLARGVLGAAWLPGQVLAATGCKGRVRISSDLGKIWRDASTAKASPQPDPGACLWPARQLAGGHAVLLGAAGKIGLLDGQGTLRWLDTGHRRTWRAAALRGEDQMLVVGDGGARGLLKHEGSSTGYAARGRVGSAIVAVGTVGRDKVYRADSEGGLEWSQDGGLHWMSAKAPKACRQLQFVDSQRGFALVGTGKLLATTDAGAQWKELVRWDDLFMKDMFFIDSRHGWVVGSRGAVARTTDGGQHWTLDRAEFDRDFLAVRFFDRKNGWAVGEKQAVFSSSDGGKTWIRRLKGRGTLRAVVPVSVKWAYVAGDQGLVLATEDGGKTWTPRPVPTDQSLMALCFTSSLKGLAVGNQGRAFVTVDGGQEWKPLKGLATRARFTRVACMASGSRCFLGSEGGWMLAGNPFR